ncbi:MAG: hypothetical protein DRP63_00765 [Planctomycetota bacterium]|nr:MAG: hypothetical protein DRP63_00765 [Planctomycetota bacterium]
MRALFLFVVLVCVGCAFKETRIPGAEEGHLVVVVDRTKSACHHDPNDRGADVVGWISALLPPYWKVSELVLTDSADWVYKERVIKNNSDRQGIYEAAKEEPDGTGSVFKYLSSAINRAASTPCPEKHLVLVTDSNPSAEHVEKLTKSAQKSKVAITSIPATPRTENVGLESLASKTNGFCISAYQPQQLSVYESILWRFWPHDRLFRLVNYPDKPFILPPSCYRLLLLTEGALVSSFAVVTLSGEQQLLERGSSSIYAHPAEHRKGSTPFDVASVESPDGGAWQVKYTRKPRASRVFAVMPFRVLVTWRLLKEGTKEVKGAKEVVLDEKKPVSAKEGDTVLLGVRIVPDKNAKEIGKFLGNVTIERIVVIPVGGGTETEIPFTPPRKRQPSTPKTAKKGPKPKKSPKQPTTGPSVSVEWPIFVRERKKELFDVVVYTRMRLKTTIWQNIRRFRMRLKHIEGAHSWILIERGIPKKVKEKTEVEGKVTEKAKTVWQWEPLAPGSVLQFGAVWRGETAGPVRLRLTNKTVLPLQLQGADRLTGIPFSLAPRQQAVCDITLPTYKEPPKDMKLAIFASPWKKGQSVQHLADYVLNLQIPMAEMELPPQPIEIVWPSARYASSDGVNSKLNYTVKRVLKGSLIKPSSVECRVEKVVSNLKGLTSVRFHPVGDKAALSVVLPQQVEDGEYDLTLTVGFGGIWRALSKKTVSFKLVISRSPAVKVDAPVKLVTNPEEPLLFGAALTPRRLPMPYTKIRVSAELVSDADSGKKVALATTIAKEADLSQPLRLRVVGFPTEGLKHGTNKARLVFCFHYLDQTTTLEHPMEIVCE